MKNMNSRTFKAFLLVLTMWSCHINIGPDNQAPRPPEKVFVSGTEFEVYASRSLHVSMLESIDEDAIELQIVGVDWKITGIKRGSTIDIPVYEGENTFAISWVDTAGNVSEPVYLTGIGINKTFEWTGFTMVPRFIEQVSE